MPGLSIYSPHPIDSDWVRAGLLEMRTVCEYWTCTTQAEYAYPGRKTVAFVCETHIVLLDENPKQGRLLEGYLWDRFQEGFNFINQVHASGGALLRDIARRDEEIERAKVQAVKDTNKLQTQARNIMRSHLAGGRVGIPDDDLAAARGVQSPLRDPFQVVFRVAEPVPPEPVTLPPHPEVAPLLVVPILL